MNEKFPKFNKFGEIENHRPTFEKKEYPIGLQLTVLYEGMSGGNVLHPNIENPEHLIYYNQRHIEDAKQVVTEIRNLAKKNNIEHLMGWKGEQTVPVQDVIKRMEESILFSETVHKKLIIETNSSNTNTFSDEELKEKREQLKNKLRKK